MFFLSLALILIGGVVIGYLFKLIKLPSLIGYLLIGILFGYFGLIDQSILNISAELRKIALIIILIKAGLNLDLKDLKKAGRPAILLSFVPACFEMIAIGLVSPYVLGLTYNESFLLGAVIGAVSPAVVVPRMVKMIEDNQGTKKSIPQMIIAGSSCDDIVMIVFFTTFLTIESGNGLSLMTFLNVPISIISGIGVGILIGLLLAFLFKKVHMRDSIKITLILGIAFGLVALESYFGQWFGFSSLLSAIALGVVILAKRKTAAIRLAAKADRLWVVAELFLFVLVGASIKVEYFPMYFLPALLVIGVGLLIRFIGVNVSLIKTELNIKERCFTTIAYMPKATVQAAIGGTLLDLGISSGNQSTIKAGTIVLSVSVVAILLTAPIGAFLVDIFKDKLVKKEAV
ncbi:MAG: cation:proton antiporter [Erysipelotrichaceae bacterium]|nr:cation:proton antiporter [Erysipelotrichaceae bacterium]